MDNFAGIHRRKIKGIDFRNLLAEMAGNILEMIANLRREQDLVIAGQTDLVELGKCCGFDLG